MSDNKWVMSLRKGNKRDKDSGQGKIRKSGPTEHSDENTSWAMKNIGVQLRWESQVFDKIIL